MLILSDAQVSQVLTMADTVAALEDSFRASAAGATVSTPWVQLFVDKPLDDNSVRVSGCQLRTSSGYAPDTQMAAVRLSADMLQIGDVAGSFRRVTVPSANGKYVGLVMLFSTETGEPLALFPDATVQHFRVGATNALGTKYLSREDSRRVGLLGAGWQAEARILAYQCVRQLESVKVYSPTKERREDFAARLTGVAGIPVVAVNSADEAVEDADIIAAATSSIGPVIKPAWLHPGVHVDCLRELEFDAAALELADVSAFNRRDPVAAPVITCRADRATYFSEGTEGGYPEVDNPRGWWNERSYWNRMVTLEDFASGAHPGRKRREDVTLFLSRGVAHQFSAVGAVVLANARAKGIGFEVPSELVLQDNPT